MASILEKKELVLNLRSELEGLINAGETEKRELNEGETSRIAEIRSQIDTLNTEIENEEQENRNLAKTENKETKQTRKMKNLKLVDAINAVIAHRSFDEDMQNEINAAKEEFRASGLDATGDIQLRALLHDAATAGAEDIATEIKPIEVAVRDNLIATKMGAQWLGNLRGDVSIPRYSGSSVLWEGEVDDAADGAGAFDDVKLSPHRLSAYIDVSKQLLIQASDDIEAMLLNDIAKAVSEKLDQTIFGAASGDTATPAGLFSASGVTTGGTLTGITYDDVLALEEAVELNNGHEYMFVVNPKVKFALKGTDRASGFGKMVLEGQELDGYKYISSNAVVAGGVACMNPRSLVIGQWSGLDITVDPYTLAKQAKVRLVVNAWYDYKLRNDEIAMAIFS